MKTRNIYILALLASVLLTTSCEKDKFLIEGVGPVVTRTLDLNEFTGIELEGTDLVYISYGPEQSVEVKGHENIIRRIKTNVLNKTWQIELEDGSYRNYELTYYITLPYLESVSNTGTGDIIVTDFPSQESLNIKIMGTGSYQGFSMQLNTCDIQITGSGNVEVFVKDRLDIDIVGTGDVYYKGSPVINADITGTGSVIRSEN